MVFYKAYEAFFFLFLSFFFFVLLTLAHPTHQAATSVTRNYFDVLDFGARADGKTDNTKAFYDTWSQACGSGGRNVVLIPTGIYLVRPIIFKGPCQGPIQVQLRGILMAPTDQSSLNTDHWISFQYIDQLAINGGGFLDGQGASAWRYNTCSRDPNCPMLPVSLRFDFILNARINHIRLINSKNFHINIFACHNMSLDHIRISAPEDSPNTDGIHIANSQNITIINSIIGTGDDCISMGPGSRDINITNVHCGPGHGISIGSLGKSPNEKDVSGIVVRNCSLRGTSNGLRIKTWAPSSPSTVSRLAFEHIYVDNVYNPIFIDQQYCPSHACSTQYDSSVKIQDVKFNNIWGISGSKIAVNLQCSKSAPCQDVELRNININFIINGESVESSCSNAYGSAYGAQNPPPCFIV